MHCASSTAPDPVGLEVEKAAHTSGCVIDGGGREAQSGNGVAEFVQACASHGSWGMNCLTEDVLGFQRGLKC